MITINCCGSFAFAHLDRSTNQFESVAASVILSTTRPFGHIKPTWRVRHRAMLSQHTWNRMIDAQGGPTSHVLSVILLSVIFQSNVPTFDVEIPRWVPGGLQAIEIVHSYAAVQ